MAFKLMDKEVGRKILLEAAGLLDALEVPFFLMQGTALGAYRDHGFTPTELDIDFGFLQENFSHRAREIVLAFASNGFTIHLIDAPFSKIRTIVAAKEGAKIDMVSFMLWKDRRFASSPVDPVNVLRPYSIVHARQMLETYEPIELFGRTFNAPSPIEKYLELEYGPDWRTPRQDHISRTRIYDFHEVEGIPATLLD